MPLRGAGLRWYKQKTSLRSMKAEEQRVKARLYKARFKARLKMEKKELRRLEHPTVTSINKSMNKMSKRFLKQALG